MPILGHGDEIESPNWACRNCRTGISNFERIRHSDACEPWGYVAPVVAAVLTHATGVRHIYLIVKLMQYKSCIFMQPLNTEQTDPSGQISICLFALMGGLLIRSYSQMMSCRVGEGRWPNSDQKKRVCMDLVLTRG